MPTNILIPTDFTEAAKTAFLNAIVVADSSETQLNVVHFCNDKDDVKESKEKLSDWVLSINSEIEVNEYVRVGDFRDLTDMVKELDAKLIFMGTHGETGFQKIWGSNALKLVSESSEPFIIVQKESRIPDENGYDQILATVSHNKESKQKVTAIIDIAKYFDSEVFLLYREEEDESLRIDTATNLVFMKRELDKAGVKYSVEVSKGKDFNADTIRVAKEHDVDLITIMNVQKNTILGSSIFAPKYEQELLMNEAHIPIMIVSPFQSGWMGNVLSLIHISEPTRPY